MTIHDTQWPDSLWRSTTGSVQDFPEVRQDIETDLLIIGAGYTGLSTALHAVDHVKEIVIIDQAQPGWGCSGRNGGQIHVQWKPDLATLKQLYPGSQFETFIKTMGAAAQLVFDLVERHQIHCQAQRAGSVIAGKGGKAIRYLTEWSQFWAEAGADVRLLDESATSELIGTAHYDRSMLDSRGGSLQPLAYSRGLARACQERGVAIYGNSRAISIRPNGKAWQVFTSAGSVICRRLVLATNGYTDNLWPGLSRTIVPVASMLTATCPLPETVTSTLLPKRQVVGEYAGVPAYYRVDETNRLVFGWRGTLSGDIGSLNTAHLRSRAERLFPQITGTEWEYDWAGYVGITSHQRPMLLGLSDHVYAGLGYNGRGVPMATMMGKQLALTITGQAAAISAESPRAVPLHPFRRIGVSTRIMFGHLRDFLN
tara:strand:+ start:766 stop:2043 length:1278 start_codon:yes stop_codon:yes gene_type:complete